MRDRLRLLHVIHTLDPQAGGAVSAVRTMCAALAARGHDVILYATGALDEDNRSSYRTRIFSMEFAPMAVSLGLARALAEAGPLDLVHIHQLYRFPQAAAAAFCRKHQIPYCVQPHGSLEPMLFFKQERRTFKRLYERLVEMRNLNRASGLIYTAAGERDAVQFLALKPPSFIVPNAVELPAFQAAKLGERFRERFGLEGKDVVAWMGRIVPVKGLDILCHAFSRVLRVHPDAVLVLIGPGGNEYETMLHGLIAKLNIAPGKIIFTGLLQGQDKIDALGAANVFALPSHTENFGIAAVEAMALGCPVVVSQGVKIAPEIERADAGLVVALDAGPLADAITSLLDDPAARLRKGAAARNLARKYGSEAVVTQLEAAYRAMISK